MDQWSEWKMGPSSFITSKLSWIKAYPPGLNILSISTTVATKSHLTRSHQNIETQNSSNYVKYNIHIYGLEVIKNMYKTLNIPYPTSLSFLI